MLQCLLPDTFRNLSILVLTSVPLYRGEEAYYPVNDSRNQALYARYKQLAVQEKNVIFGGRLAEYKYYNMDQVVKSALECVKRNAGMA